MIKFQTFIFFLILSFSGRFVLADEVIDKNDPPADLDLYVEYCVGIEYCGVHLKFNELMTPEELAKWGHSISPVQTPAKKNQYYLFTGEGKKGQRIGIINTEPGSGKFTTIFAPADDPARQYLLMLELGFKMTPGAYFRAVTGRTADGEEAFKNLPVILSGVFNGLQVSKNGTAVKMNIPERPEKIACRLVSDESPLIDVGTLKEGDSITLRGVFESHDNNILMADCYIWKNQDEFDLRQVRWGMSRNDVIKSEPDSPVDMYQDALIYKAKIDNVDYRLLYYFLDGQELAAASFSIDHKYMNKNSYLLLYSQLCEQLIQKYGQPVSDETQWGQTDYMNKADSLAFAYSLGHVTTTRKWETPTTIITAILGGKSLNVFVGVDYESKRHYDEMEKRREEAASGRL